MKTDSRVCHRKAPSHDVDLTQCMRQVQPKHPVHAAEQDNGIEWGRKE